MLMLIFLDLSGGTVEGISNVLDFFLHLDHHMNLVIQDYGHGTYLILFLIIFCETGLVVTPFLPGDSLLFVTGALAASGPLKVGWLLILLTLAAILGDTVNYWIGHLLAPKVFRHENIRFIKKEYLTRTQHFYDKYGGKTIILARFVPMIRTFAPFLAGVGSMQYRRFFSYNVLGGFLWIMTFTCGGYFFGNLPIVKKNFSLVIFAIIATSLLPAILEFLRHRRGEALSRR